jgi:uncharacterized protein
MSTTTEIADPTGDGKFYSSVKDGGLPILHPMGSRTKAYPSAEKGMRMSSLLVSTTTTAQNKVGNAVPLDCAVARVGALDWPSIQKVLEDEGRVLLPKLLDSEECKALVHLYPDDTLFRSHIIMGRHGFGRGEYKYFNYPLPDIIQSLRTALYPRFARVADRWNEVMGIEVRYPESHSEFVRRCHKAGQARSTPLLLQYGEGDFNCLHQDLYGEHVFPIQVTILLSEPATDFTGGEFVLTEQRPRMQSKPEVVPLRQGDAVAFAVHHRPVQGRSGTYRVNLRHGVSRLRSGRRHAVGIIFHDAT